jgi:hypothetical protein
MQLHVEAISHIGPARDLIFAAVQLDPPALDPVTKNKTYEWKAPKRAARIDDIKNILAALFAPAFSKKPDIVIFPEYSVPEEAFNRIAFQEFANTHRAIIIAGSYFDIDDSKKTFRNNISKIFVPDRGEPLSICKASPSPREIDFLKTNPAMPNVARLLWSPPTMKPLSINIFLCRDYLTPFKHSEASKPEAPDTIEHVSLLDWMHEGINIAVLNNRDPTLFEAAAGFDVRMMHGMRKLVLVVNSSNESNLLATTLFGPSKDPNREADVAAKIASDEEGVLIVQTRLWNVKGSKDFPDTVESFPVSHWEALTYNRADGCLRPAKKEQPIPEKRRIFHPAFLAALRKDMLIEFYVAKSIQEVERAFDSNKIRHVTASHVRGIEDIVIRRYIDKRTTEGGIPEKLSLPFCYLTDKDFDRAFDTSSNASSLKILIDPKHIMKIRGVAVPPQSPEEWKATSEEILAAIDYGLEEKEALAFAKGIPSSTNIPKKFEPIFSLGTEEIVPIGKDHKNGIREVYVLVSSEGHEGSAATRPFMIYINDHLMKDKKVRDICQITKILPQKRQSPFEFLLRLKCTAFETDDVIYSMQKWAARNKVRVGTRTYDLWRHITRNSIDGIIDGRLTEAEQVFLAGLFSIDPEANWNLAGEIRERLAESALRHDAELRKLGRLGVEAGRHLKDFYYNLVLVNIDTPRDKIRYVEDSQKAWTQLYKYFERWSKALLAHALKEPPTISNSALTSALLAKFSKELEKTPESVKNDPIRMFVRFYPICRPSAPVQLMNVAREANNLITPPRNYSSHGGNETEWSDFIRLNRDDWQAPLEQLEAKANLMCKLLVELSKELSANRIRFDGP